MAVLVGCTVGPDYKRPNVSVPAHCRNSSEQRKSTANPGWWELFEDPTLEQLIGAAMVANNDVQVAVARVLEARAQLGIARAAQFPQISAGTSLRLRAPLLPK
jgi:outer membrane protein, multidrug efflux system